MTNSVTFPVNLGGDGSTVTDDDNASTGLGNGGHRNRFVPAMGQMVAVANVLTQRLSEQSDTSSTSVAIATGSKTFVTAGFYEWAVGMWVTITSAANPANYMFGQVTSWTTATNTVIIDVDSVGGSGTYSDWTIALSAYSSIGDYLTDADIGVTVQPYDADTPTVAATKAEMQAGTETAIRSMSPLRVAEAISGLVSGRNKIINGAMMIDQRNAGAAVTLAGGITYLVDRLKYYGTQASKFSAQQNAGSVTPPAGFTNYIGFTSSSAYSSVASDAFAAGQVIEGYNIADLAWGTANAKSITLSFWVYSSLTGLFGGSVYNFAGTRGYVFSFNITSANTWQYVTVTIPGDTGGAGTWLTNNSNGIQLFFNLGSGSSNLAASGSWYGGYAFGPTGATSVVGTNGATFYITGVQLEKGATATPFENRLYGAELALCQRYYAMTFSQGTAPASGSGQGGALLTINGSGTGVSVGLITAWQFPVEMRVGPTVTTYNPSASGSAWYLNTAATVAAAVANSGTRMVTIYNNATSTSGTNAAIHLTATAEL